MCMERYEEEKSETGGTEEGKKERSWGGEILVGSEYTESTNENMGEVGTNKVAAKYRPMYAVVLVPVSRDGAIGGGQQWQIQPLRQKCNFLVTDCR